MVVCAFVVLQPGGCHRCWLVSTRSTPNQCWSQINQQAIYSRFCLTISYRMATPVNVGSATENQVHHHQVVDSKFVKACGDRAIFFEPANTPLNHISTTIVFDVIAERTTAFWRFRTRAT